MTAILHFCQFTNKAAAYAALASYAGTFNGRSCQLIVDGAFNAAFCDDNQGQGIPIVQTPAVYDSATPPNLITPAVFASGYFINVMLDTFDASMPGLTAAADSINPVTGVAHLVDGSTPTTPQRRFA